MISVERESPKKSKAQISRSKEQVQIHCRNRARTCVLNLK